MGASVLESTPSTIAAPLTSSFLPRLGLVLPLPASSRARSSYPPSSSPSASFHGVFAAAAKQKKKASSARDWSYEHLMVVWDEVFERCCSDPAKATHIRDVSRRGLAEHGRGCVLVYQSIKTKPRGKGTGFTSKPPRTSLDVPEFVVLEWNAVYVPREFLLDPRKAPDEDVRSLDATAVDISLIADDLAARSSFAPAEEVEGVEPAIVDSAAHYQVPAFAENGRDTEHGDDANASDFVLIDSPASRVNESSPKLEDFEENGNVRPHNAVALDITTNEDDHFINGDNLAEGVQFIEAENDHSGVRNEGSSVQLVNQQMLISALRGVGVTRLVSLTANFDSEYGDFRSPARGAVVDTRTMDAGGEDPYNPANEEVVLMLHLFVDGKPAVGADVVIAHENELDFGDSEDKSKFKLRLKYSI